MELSTWKDGFNLGQHVTEDQRELGKVPSAREKKYRLEKRIQRKVDSQHFLLSQFLVLELFWTLMCHTVQSDARSLKGTS